MYDSMHATGMGKTGRLLGMNMKHDLWRNYISLEVKEGVFLTVD